jgi:hypothetical protein
MPHYHTGRCAFFGCTAGPSVSRQVGLKTKTDQTYIPSTVRYCEKHGQLAVKLFAVKDAA